jgi:hypothetical protein
MAHADNERIGQGQDGRFVLEHKDAGHAFPALHQLGRCSGNSAERRNKAPLPRL